MSLSSRLSQIQQIVENARNNTALASAHTRILAASKAQSMAQIEEAIACGLTLFGENRVQEAADKWPPLKQRYPEVRLHLIGPLQTNKAKDALALFDVIQTLDRPKLAAALAAEMKNWRNEELKKKSIIPHLLNSSFPQFYIQINTGEEPQKSGIAPKEADDFIVYCKNDLALPVVGLMCVPPENQPPAPHFALLRQIANNHGLSELSMGMSGDYEAAIRMGSSCVRIGTALFGERTLK